VALPKKNQGPKASQICPNFGRLQTLKVNISGMDASIQN